MGVIKIRKFEEKYLTSLNLLLKEAYDVERVGNINNDVIELIAINNEEVVGYLNINKLYNPINNIYYGYINYVCVLKKFRRRNIATSLFKEVEDIAKREEMIYLELTSNSKRIEAHKLYTKLNFKMRDTNVFRKEF